MALIVQKYGGTSLADLCCIRKVAQKIIDTKNAGNDVVVVVSAMAGQTDYLDGLAKAINPQPSARELSTLLATGEQASMALLAIQLNTLGYPAKSFMASQVRIITTGQFHQARIHKIETETITREIQANAIVIIAGFQGVDKQGNITTLGRGGSDTTAVAIAAALNAAECQIYTDVAGVYSADPHIVPEARLISEVTFAEMLELASLGAKVLQNRAVEFAGRYKVPLRVLSTFEDGIGTLIKVNNEPMESAIVSSITYSRNEAKFTFLGISEQSSLIYKILDPMGKADIRVDMIMHNGDADFSFTVCRDDYHKTLAIIDKLQLKVSPEKIITNTQVGKLSIIGIGMHSHSGVASKMLESLRKEGIVIHNIASAELKISVVIDEKHLELGVRTLHSAFSLASPPTEEVWKRDR